MDLYLQDVMSVLKVFSLKFQEENSVAADINLSIKITMKQLQAMKLNDGTCLQKLNEFLTTDAPSGSIKTRSLVELTKGQGDIEKQREQLLNNICQAMSI